MAQDPKGSSPLQAGGVGAPGLGEGAGRDFGGGRSSGFDGSWGQGFGGSRETSDYRDPGGEIIGDDFVREQGGFGVADAASERSWLDQQAEAGGPHRGKGPAGWSRGDVRLREEVCERFLHDRLLDAREIEVAVEGGVVTLTGEVPGASDPRLAEMIAKGAPGVQQVVNQLQVTGGERRPGGGARHTPEPNPFRPEGQDHALTSTERLDRGTP